MRQVLRIAHAELLEQLRQPWMLVILVANYALWLGLFSVIFLSLDRIQATPELATELARRLAENGVTLDALLKALTSLFGSLGFTTLPACVGVLAGLAVLHDRTCGTLPFLMLAPLTRGQLLLGKLAGVLVVPLVLHVAFLGVGGVLFGGLPLLAAHAHRIGGHPAWWVAFALGAPASAALMGAFGTVVSALSRDARTSMQYANFLIALFSLVVGFLLDGGADVGLQLAYAAGCLVVTALTLFVGAQLISADAAA